MKIGLQIPSFTWPGGDAAIGPTLARVARQADDIGIDSLWVMDHFFQIRGVGRAEEPMLEGWSALNFMAANTRRATLGLMVGGIHYRQAALWAKCATTLDVLSGGRAWLGIGAAWNQEESAGLGFPMPPLGTRFEMLEETLQYVLAMWEGERGTEKPFEGRHYQAARLLNSPQAIHKPHPPIMIGGGGEQKTLRLVATYADATNIFGGPDQLRHKYEVLRRHCEDVGRPYDQILRTTLQSIDLAQETPDVVVRRFEALAGAGAQGVIFNMKHVYDERNLETLGRDIVPRVHQIEAAEP